MKILYRLAIITALSAASIQAQGQEAGRAASPQVPSAPEVAQGQSHDEEGLLKPQDPKPTEPQHAARPDQPATGPVVPGAPAGVAAQPQPDVVAPRLKGAPGDDAHQGNQHPGGQNWLYELHVTDWIQAGSNVCLLIANIALFAVTRKTANAAQTSAEAALRQVEVMAAVEAPVIRVTNVLIGGIGLMDRQGRPKIPDTPFLIVDLVNRGRTSGGVVSFGFDKVVMNGPPPEVREADPINIRRDLFLLPADSYELSQVFDLDAEERRHIMIAHEHLWIWGFVDFEDGLGKVRRHRFFLQAIPDASQDKLLFVLRPLRPPPLIA